MSFQIAGQRNRYLEVLALLGCLCFAACSKQSVSARTIDPADVKVEKVRDPNIVEFDHAEKFPLTTATEKRFTETLDANGSVAPDVSRTVPVVALSSGRVLEMRARLGDTVQKGQILMTMTSPDMSQAISDFRKFQTDERLAKVQLDRFQLLFSKGAAAMKDVEVAQDGYDKAQVDTRTASERIRILGGDLRNPTSILEITAPTSGTIVEQNVTAAAGVKSLDNSPNLFTIADLSNVWVVCDVYENNLGQVRIGDKAVIELNAYPDRRFQGTIANISSMLDPNTRSAKVRIELANPKGVMRPNMFATVHFTSQSSSNHVVVPSTAVLRLQDKDWVFVKLNEKQFRKTSVTGGPVDGDGHQQILAGLTTGSLIVADALTFDRETQKEQP